MKNFSKIDKQIINDLLQQDASDMPIITSYIKHYFKNNNVAIFSTNSREEVFILYQNQEYYKKAIKLIIDIISLLEFLEQEGYIYCIKIETNQSFIIYESSEIDVGITNNGSYTISNGRLEIENGTAKLYDLTNNLILSGSCCQKELTHKILCYFRCIVYPTETLKKLVQNNFETLEVISYKREIKEAKISRNFAWAALIISLFLPFGMTFFNNKFATTEITEYQYKEIIQKMEKLSESPNSINKNQIQSEDSTLKQK